MFNTRTDEYENALTKKVLHPVFRVYILNPDFSIYKEVNNIVNDSGSITINLNNGVRRTATFSIVNTDNSYLLDSNGINQITTLYKIYTGLLVNETEYLFSQGVYIQKDPEVVSLQSKKIITMNLIDLYGEMDGQTMGVLESDYEITNGTSFSEAVKMIISLIYHNNVNIIIAERYYNFSICCDITVTAGSNISDLMDQVCNLVSCSYYFDTDGNYIILDSYQDIDDTLKPEIYSYSQYSPYLGMENMVYNTSKVKNVCMVLGTNVFGMTTATAIVGSHTIQYNLSNTVGYFSTTAGTVITNWVLSGENLSDLGTISSISIINSQATAEITITGTIGSTSQVYYIAPSTSALMTGYTAPSAIQISVLTDVTKQTTIVSNGYAANAEAINDDPLSPVNVNRIGRRCVVVQDQAIYNNALAEQRAAWEIKKYSIIAITYNFYSTFIPHLDVNQVVKLSDPACGLYKKRCLIKSITYDLTTGGKMTIQGTNTNDAGFSITS